jgi:hypothetical protein
MRTELLTAIQALSLGTFRVSNELPYEQDGAPLYFKNFRTIYVDMPQMNQTPVFDALDGLGWINEDTTVSAYFVTDAKQLPANYFTLVDAVKESRLTTQITGVTQRTCEVTTEYVAANLVTQFVFSFRKLLN